MNRREFHQYAAELALVSLLPGCVTPSRAPETRIATTSYSGSKGFVLATIPKGPEVTIVRVFDWNTHAFVDHEVPLDFVHSISQDRRDKQTLYLFEAYGSAAKVDLKTGSVMKIDHREGDVMFNGHGTLSLENDFIACTEISDGWVTTRLRSTKDFSVLDELPKQCRSAHQVAVMPNSTLLAMGNLEGYESSISFYDHRAKRIVNHFKTPGHAYHLLPISSSEVLGTCSMIKRPFGREDYLKLKKEDSALKNQERFLSGSSYDPVPLVRASVDGKVQPIYDEKHSDYFLLNFGISKGPSDRILSTHLKSNKVLVWKDSKIEKVIDTPRPMNVTVSADGTEFMFLAEGKLHIHSLVTFALVKELTEWPMVSSISSYS